MVYKLINEEGLYIDKTTKEDRNLLEAEIAYTPEGINIGWDEFDSIEDAIEYYNLELKIKN